MANVYSLQLAALAGLNGAFTVGPPPSGFIWVLRDLDAYYNGLLEATVRLIGDQGQTIFYNGFSAAGNPQYASWRGRQVIPDGRSFQLSATQPIDVTVSGYQLALP